MRRRVVTLRADMRVIDAMRKLIRHRISGAPVLDADGNLVGLVSEFDCLRVVASGLYGHARREDSQPLSEIMTTDVLTISPEMDVFSLIQLLVDKRIRRVPVAVGGKVVGIISRHDVLRSVHDLRRAQLRPERPQKKGLYLSVTDESGDVIDSLLD